MDTHTLQTSLIITSVHNSGDISGIMCTVETADGFKMACVLTHLIFHGLKNLLSKKREKD